jgi:hypothetical protein
MKNLIPRSFDEFMALSLSTLAIVSWMMIWCHA